MKKIFMMVLLIFTVYLSGCSIMDRLGSHVIVSNEIFTYYSTGKSKSSSNTSSEVKAFYSMRALTEIKVIEFTVTATFTYNGEILETVTQTYDSDGTQYYVSFGISVKEDTFDKDADVTCVFEGRAKESALNDRVYTITFNHTYFSKISYVQVAENDVLSESKTPSVSFFELDYWTENKTTSIPYDYSKMVTSSFTLYAVYK